MEIEANNIHIVRRLRLIQKIENARDTVNQAVQSSRDVILPELAQPFVAKRMDHECKVMLSKKYVKGGFTGVVPARIRYWRIEKVVGAGMTGDGASGLSGNFIGYDSKDG